jgi:hypothetical protein
MDQNAGQRIVAQHIEPTALASHVLTGCSTLAVTVNTYRFAIMRSKNSAASRTGWLQQCLCYGLHNIHVSAMSRLSPLSGTSHPQQMLQNC